MKKVILSACLLAALGGSWAWAEEPAPAEPAPAAEAVSAAEPEPAAESVPEPEPALEAEPVAVTEPAPAEPVPVVEDVPAAEPELVVETEPESDPAVEAEPAAVMEPASAESVPVVEDVPPAEPEPVVETAPESNPAGVTEAAVVEAVPEVEPATVAELAAAAEPRATAETVPTAEAVPTADTATAEDAGTPGILKGDDGEAFLDEMSVHIIDADGDDIVAEAIVMHGGEDRRVLIERKTYRLSDAGLDAVRSPEGEWQPIRAGSLDAACVDYLRIVMDSDERREQFVHELQQVLMSRWTVEGYPLEVQILIEENEPVDGESVAMVPPAEDEPETAARPAEASSEDMGASDMMALAGGTEQPVPAAEPAEGADPLPAAELPPESKISEGAEPPAASAAMDTEAAWPDAAENRLENGREVRADSADKKDKKDRKEKKENEKKADRKNKQAEKANASQSRDVLTTTEQGTEQNEMGVFVEIKSHEPQVTITVKTGEDLPEHSVAAQ